MDVMVLEFVTSSWRREPQWSKRRSPSNIIVLTMRACLLWWAVAAALEPLPRIWPAASTELYSEPSTVAQTVRPTEWSLDYNDSWPSGVQALIQQANARFLACLMTPPSDAKEYPVNPLAKNLWPIVGVRVSIASPLAVLEYGVDESYHVEVRPIIDNDGMILVNATTIYGLVRAYQTLWQLLDFGWLDGDDPVYLIDNGPIVIQDAPAYPYRGLLLDTSRHYLPLERILDTISTMAMNKLNVLHWHLTDSQSWPYLSRRFPELSEKGAYCRACVYTPAMMRHVQQWAASHGILVIVEMDLPGHSQAIGASHPEFLSECGPAGPSEPLNVTAPAVWDFVQALYDELDPLLVDRWIHIGGDEVWMDCWRNSSSMHAWMIQHNMTNEVQVLEYFERQLLAYVTQQLQRRPIVWQELFDLGLDLPPSTVIDVWKEWDLSAREKATRVGHDVLLSACWYLDHLDEDWRSMYRCDPRNFNGTRAQKAHVIGGHASMWGERVDETDLVARVWPRASAMAEKLWTGNRTSAIMTAASRLERFRCLMVQQGIEASPIGPGSCRYKPSGQQNLLVTSPDERADS